jgi:serine/threonine protein kinase
MDGEELTLLDPYHLVGSTLLEKYRIEALVGLGGMGAVYSAHHLALNRRVAFKIMLPNLAINNQRMVDLFEREAKMAGQLSHECIVDVKDAGRTGDGIAYLVMEWLEGVTLDDVIVSEGPLSFKRAGEILRQVAAALEAAHAKQVIHRDLKPSNIMLASRPDGRLAVKVLDFGLARVASETADSPVSMMIGTPHYASPEQFQVGGQIDQRADLYSLGVTLYQMLTGEVPFKAPSFREIIRQQQTQPPPPLRLRRADAPAALEELVFRLLAKDPSRRPQTAGEVVRHYERAIHAVNEDKPEPNGSPHRTTHIDPVTDRRRAASDPTLIRENDTIKIKAVETQKNNQITLSEKIIGEAKPAVEPRKPGFRLSFDFQWNKRRISFLLSLGLAVVFCLPLYRFLNRSRPASSESASPAAAAPPAPGGVGLSDATKASRSTLEVLGISLEVDSRNEKKLQRIDQPISRGQAIRFHFIPRERGYLYILAPNQNNIPTTFLTAQPVPKSGVKTNLIEAGQDFRFPTGPGNDGVSFTKDETSMAFTIIFSSQPLTSPGFLNGRANRELNGTEQNELAQLRRELESTTVQLTPSSKKDSLSGILIANPANRKFTGAILTDIMITIEPRP